MSDFNSLPVVQITTALQVLRPGAQWVLQGSDLSGLTWIDTVQTRPTDAEITTQIATQG